MAIDRRGAVELLHGGQTPATSFVPPGLEGYSQQGGLPFDPALAREELKKAGLVPSSVNIDLVIRNSDKEILIAQYLQNQLQKNLGITLSIHPFDGKAFRSQIDSGSFGLFENSWSADFVDPNNFLSLFIADSGSNRTRWKDPKYDQLVSARLYPKAQQLLLKDAAVILPLYYESNTALIKPRVRGLSITPLGGVFLRDVILDTGHSG
jgi:oligopeptide transport system substrate-binding protein